MVKVPGAPLPKSIIKSYGHACSNFLKPCYSSTMPRLGLVSQKFLPAQDISLCKLNWNLKYKTTTHLEINIVNFIICSIFLVKLNASTIII